MRFGCTSLRETADILANLKYVQTWLPRFRPENVLIKLAIVRIIILDYNPLYYTAVWREPKYIAYYAYDVIEMCAPAAPPIRLRNRTRSLNPNPKP